MVGRKGWIGAWDGNVLKLGCDDGYTTINIIKFTELLKNKKTIFRFFIILFTEFFFPTSLILIH